jgi:hypothetical protein
MKISSTPENNGTENDVPGRTVIRSIRIPKFLDALLVDEAHADNLSVNSLVLRILKSYNSFYLPAEKTRLMSLDLEVVKELISSMSDEGLKQLGARLGGRLPEASILFWYGHIDEETFMKWVHLLSKYYRWGEIGFSAENGHRVLLAHHTLGMKWSSFVGAFLTAAAETTLHVHAKVEVLTDVIKVEVPRAQPTTV